MSQNSFRVTSPNADQTSQPSFLIKRDRSPKWLRLWYRFSSPPEPPASASIEELDKFRRGRTASQIFLMVSIFLVAALPGVALSSNIGIVLTISVSLILVILSSWLNRRGYVTIAGLIITLAFMGGPVHDLSSVPGGNSWWNLAGLNILVVALIIAASVLPRIWVVGVAIVNIGLILLIVLVFPHSKELATDIKVHLPDIIVVPILMQILITLVTVIWVGGAKRSLARADRAEEIARLEYDIAQQSLVTVEEKKQLEQSVQQIVETHQRFANGDINARVPLTHRNVLWQVSGLLNNVLVRFQSLRQQVAELHRAGTSLQRENTRLAQTLQAYRQREALTPPRVASSSLKMPTPPKTAR